MLDRYIEHPDAASGQRTGYGCGAIQENRDTPERRREFAEEFFQWFLEYVQDGDPDILEHFTEHYKWKYKDFLN